jgi:hypothetical protein
MASIRDVHTDTTYTGRTPESIVRRVYGRTAELRPEHGTGRYTVTRRAPRKHGDNAHYVLGVITIQR